MFWWNTLSGLTDFSMPQNVSRGVSDVFSFMRSGKLMWILGEKITWISPSFSQADTCCQRKLLELFCRVIVTCQMRGSSEQDKYPVFSAVSWVLVCCFYLNSYWKFCKKSSGMCQIPHVPIPSSQGNRGAKRNVKHLQHSRVQTEGVFFRVFF